MNYDKILTSYFDMLVLYLVVKCASFKLSVLLGYNAVSMENHIPTFGGHYKVPQVLGPINH